MPYRLKGNVVYKKTASGMKKVGKSRKGKRYLRVLQAIEHGWKPTRRRK